LIANETATAVPKIANGNMVILRIIIIIIIKCVK
jgi:hypothetical protein